MEILTKQQIKDLGSANFELLRKRGAIYKCDDCHHWHFDSWAKLRAILNNAK